MLAPKHSIGEIENKDNLKQRSQTGGPREVLLRPAISLIHFKHAD